MARRTTKAENQLYGYLVVFGLIIGIPVYLFQKVDQTVGWQGPALLLGFGVVLLWIISFSKKRVRLARLRAKYPEADVQRIIRKTIWIGETAEQLTESLGHPSAIDEKLLKTKHRNVWKYQHQGANRYGLRITVENGHVAGWDAKA